MCNLATEWNIGLTSQVKNEIIARLGEIIGDGLIEVTENKITVKEEGRMFVRNICMAFDLRLVENQPEIRIFSMTI